MRLKLNTLYYKHLIDKCLIRFFTEYNSKFVKNSDGVYVYSDMLNETTLFKIFNNYLKDEMSTIVREFKESKPEYFFILGDCIPSENIFLPFVKKQQKIKKLISIIPDIKYFLKEQDICIDMRLIGTTFDNIFIKYMSEKTKTWRNVFFIEHPKMDSYTLFKTIKKRYGKMVVNMRQRLDIQRDRCIFGVNDIIDEKCNSKETVMTEENVEYYYGINEVYQYIDTCLSGDT